MMKYLGTVVAGVIVCGLPAWVAAQAPARVAEFGTGPKGMAVSVPWRAGNAEGFQMGAVEEQRAKSTQGLLPVSFYRPEGVELSPIIVLMHGCGGLTREATWTAWVQPWVDLFLEQGVGTAVCGNSRWRDRP